MKEDDYLWKKDKKIWSAEKSIMIGSIIIEKRRKDLDNIEKLKSIIRYCDYIKKNTKILLDFHNLHKS